MMMTTATTTTLGGHLLHRHQCNFSPTEFNTINHRLLTGREKERNSVEIPITEGYKVVQIPGPVDGFDAVTSPWL